MKVKLDFVTNSSSASFVLSISVEPNIDISEFNKLWDKYVNFFLGEYSYKLQEKIDSQRKHINELKDHQNIIKEKIKNGMELNTMDTLKDLWYKQLSEKDFTEEGIKRSILGNMIVTDLVSGVFEISQWTSMFNDYGDIPKWMIHLIILNNVDKSEMFSKFGFKEVKLKILED